MASKESSKDRVPRRRTERLVVEELPGETLVYDLERHKAHCLGSALAALWRRCDGRITVARLARRVTAETGAPVDEQMVGAALHRLQRARLLDEATPPASASLSARREVLRRLAVLGGFTLLTVAAPHAAQAASCQANCNTTSQGPGGRNCTKLPCCEPQFAGLTCQKQTAGTLCACI